MNLAETFAFYLVLGVAVAAAHVFAERASWVSALGACVFWPLYLPLVLSNRSAGSPVQEMKQPTDELSEAIDLVQRELDAAVAGLDGWAENVLHQKTDRLRELRGALTAQADRIRDMEALLAREQAVPAKLETNSEQTSERWERSCQARQENMARLARLCRQARSDLLATLAWVRELVSMIHLAKFTGAPAARAEELVAQIAAAVESVAALSDRAEPAASPFLSGVN